MLCHNPNCEATKSLEPLSKQPNVLCCLCLCTDAREVVPTSYFPGWNETSSFDIVCCSLTRFLSSLFTILSQVCPTARTSRIEKDDQEPDPAGHDSHGRVRTDEHEGQEFEAGAENERVAERAVGDQRDGDGGVEEREAVEEEVAWVGGTRWRHVSLSVATSGNLIVSWLGGKEEEEATNAGAKRSKARRNAISQKIV